MEGPRAVRSEDRESLRALVGVVFRPSLMDEYPHLFDEENYENLRVCVEDGRCVAHVGTIVRGAVLEGCAIQVGSLGGVATQPEFRKLGLASACFDAALDNARAQGADLMLVSGDRSLYRMRGCLHVGRDLGFRVATDAITPELERMASGITVEKMTDDELPLVMECYRAEPVRFQRPPSDYHHALACGWVMNRASDFLVIRQDGAFRGYVIAQEPGEDGSCGLAEFAGDRHAVRGALPHIMRRRSLTSIGFQVMGHDHLMRSLCEQAGLEGKPRSTPGTLTVLNFPRLMERLRPRFEEVLGYGTAARLRFRQEDDVYGFALNGQELPTDRDTATRMLFGTVDGPSEALVTARGPLGEALRAVFPLPTLWYGVNYV